MKNRIKQLVITGIIFIIMTIIGLTLISFFKDYKLTIKWISNALFTEFLILLTIGCFLLIKEGFPSKFNQAQNKKEKTEGRLNSGLELIIISLPLAITSILITFLIKI